jgi:hypothetical protein
MEPVWVCADKTSDMNGLRPIAANRPPAWGIAPRVVCGTPRKVVWSLAGKAVSDSACPAVSGTIRRGVLSAARPAAWSGASRALGQAAYRFARSATVQIACPVVCTVALPAIRDMACTAVRHTVPQFSLPVAIHAEHRSEKPSCMSITKPHRGRGARRRFRRGSADWSPRQLTAYSQRLTAGS